MYGCCFYNPQDPYRVLCGRDAPKFKRKFDLNTANDGASAKPSPFHALIVFEENYCLYGLVVCMTNRLNFIYASIRSPVHKSRDDNVGAVEEIMCVMCVRKYDLRKGDLYVLSLARVRQVRRRYISSELLMCGRGAHIILLLPLVDRYLETIDVCIWHMFVFMYVVEIVWECLLCSGHC